ncbi:hypothetical protein, conserved [Eimeria praecox]|uniref:Uncharacterized protein n=1 Tax=Eimeria praecox TaxID=51316 RepID=U6G6K1_9EIME|nr:hypothetical protein, conserved [Eimeria praecox]
MGCSCTRFPPLRRAGSVRQLARREDAGEPKRGEGGWSGRTAVRLTAPPGAQQCKTTPQMASGFSGGLVLREAPPLDQVVGRTAGSALVHGVVDFVLIRGIACSISGGKPLHDGLLRFLFGGAGADVALRPVAELAEKASSSPEDKLRHLAKGIDQHQDRVIASLRKRAISNEIQADMAPAAGRNIELVEKAGRLLLEGLGGAELRTGHHLGVSVIAHAGPIIKFAER